MDTVAGQRTYYNVTSTVKGHRIFDHIAQMEQTIIKGMAPISHPKIMAQTHKIIQLKSARLALLYFPARATRKAMHPNTVQARISLQSLKPASFVAARHAGIGRDVLLYLNTRLGSQGLLLFCHILPPLLSWGNPTEWAHTNRRESAIVPFCSSKVPHGVRAT